MINYFEQFVKDELNEHLEDFMNQSVQDFCNDEYIIQTMHDWMHEFMVDAIKVYLNSKEN